MDEKDMHCVARLLQGAIYKNDLLFSCRFCKYSEECTKNLKDKKTIHLDIVRRKLQDITGVYLEVKIGSRDIETRLAQATNKHAVKQ